MGNARRSILHGDVAASGNGRPSEWFSRVALPSRSSRREEGGAPGILSVRLGRCHCPGWPSTPRVPQAPWGWRPAALLREAVSLTLMGVPCPCTETPGDVSWSRCMFSKPEFIKSVSWFVASILKYFVKKFFLFISERERWKHQ